MNFLSIVFITMAQSTTSPQYSYDTDNVNEPEWDMFSEDYEHLAKEEKLAHLSQIYSATSGYCYNAITRHPYPFKKNQPEARKLFMVHDSLGVMGRTEPYKMYYDTPEQYERHRRVRLNPDIIDLFYERQRHLAESNSEES